jgi:chemotaxis protein MotB
MSKEGRPVIIKRVKRVSGGHHGGAWKVAYADFVTAMMAFFLLMWLLSSTSEEQRRGLADYFAPNVALPSTTTGGDGPFAGRSMFSEDRFIDEADNPARGRDGSADLADLDLAEIEDELLGGSGDAHEADPLLRHVRTRLTDEGLIIEIFDIENSPLFLAGGAEPSPVLEKLGAMIGRVIARTANPVAVTGHLGRTTPEDDPWQSSIDRAQAARAILVAAGVSEPRFARITGKADREPARSEPDDPRNSRIEITLLRRFPQSGAAEAGRAR